MEPRRIRFMDTTLRDGEQTPGVNLNVQDKLKIAQALDEMHIDVIEAGFAGSSDGDFACVSAIAKACRFSTVSSLSRAVALDIERAARAVEAAQHPCIHTFIATSDVHMKYKLRMEPEQVYDRAMEAVRLAKKYTPVVEFSCEDATRSDRAFIYRILEGVINEGATVLNIPDTVGYIEPMEFYDLIRSIRENVPNIDRAFLSVHCHDDLGNAVANSMAGVAAGATYVEGTINGIGERAGNAALEEVIMNLYTRRNYFNCTFEADTHQISRVSKLVSSLTNISVPVNKAVVGANAFAHESGIHQHGVLANPETYEILSPEVVGAKKNALVLGKLSGKHAFAERLKELGYVLSEEELTEAFKKFKDLADRKREVTDEDLEAIASQRVGEVPAIYDVQSFRIYCGNGMDSTASLILKRDDQTFSCEASAPGPVDAAFKAIDGIVNLDITLEKYDIKAVTEGKDALGEVTVMIKKNGKLFRGRAISTDIIESSIEAYVAAINRCISEITD